MKKFTLLLLALTINVGVSQAQEWNQLGETFQYEGQPVSTTIMSGDGNVVAVSTSFSKNSEITTGFAKVYEYTNGQWVQLGENIEFGDVQAGITYGDNADLKLSLSTDGHTIAIGAPYSDTNGNNSGKVGVFTYNGTAWTQVGEDIIGDEETGLGGSISLTPEGNRLVTGAYAKPTGATLSGSVKIYELNGSAWQQVGQTITSAANEGTSFGYDVDINDAGTTIVATYYDGGGARVYQLDGTVWIQTAFLNDIPVGYASFNAEGNRLALGSFTANSPTGTMFAGKTTVYENQAGTWTQLGNALYGSAMFQMFARVRLNATGDILAVGSEGISNLIGKAEVYKMINNEWYPIGTIVDDVKGTFYGQSVTLSNDGEKIMVGGHEGAGAATAHYARAFEFACVAEAPVAINAEAACGSDTVTLSVEETENVTYKWYASADAAEPLFTGAVFQTEVLTETTNYWVEAVSYIGCVSERTETAATVNPIPNAPIAETTQSFTEGNTLADLEVNAEGEITWYADEELVTEIPETTTLVHGTTYYATQLTNGCTSTAVTITVQDKALNTDSVAARNISYFPNPVSDKLYFGNTSELQSIQLYDITGRLVKSNNTQGITEIDMTDVAAGTYIVKAKTENAEKSFKVIKQ